MKVNIVGAGPAGLYLAYLLKTRWSASRVSVFERNPAGATFGFGVVLAGRGMANLEFADPASFRLIRQKMKPLRHQTLHLNGNTLAIEGTEYGGAIERLALLRVLQGLCFDAGVEITFECDIRDTSALDECDVLVGADGANSSLRRNDEAAFGAEGQNLTNRFAWFGVERRFDEPNLSFRSVGNGAFCAHYYGYSDRMSTIVMECDETAWRETELDSMDDPARRYFCENLYADDFDGLPFVTNNSHWRQFPVITNRHWVSGKRVLIGDAARSAHFSIGSGTRIAMEDSIALADALCADHGSVPEALMAYEASRKPASEKLLDAARQSYRWYENMAQHMRSGDIYDLSYAFLTRTNRVDQTRLRREYPAFVDSYTDRRRNA